MPNNDQVPVTLAASGNSTGNDFLDTNLGTIAGQVRYDSDNDGDLTDADSGLAGAKVSLFTDPNGDGNPADGVQVGVTITTDGTGNYLFTNLLPGNYVVVEVNPAGYTSTADTAPPNNDLVPVMLAASANSTGNDFLDALLVVTVTSDAVCSGKSGMLTATVSGTDRKSTRLNSSHVVTSRMPSSA